ncbi:HypA [Desulforapulum autotrophicum HRM2]|uniref:Hydrogenase maturation factor HypA n=1 Tax=Desulforapulum autotrophicum (strain ATCC 43914 / DSM 3382 / VKM B-1955 / HRM2) TaxID=177437 RepID=C0QKY0_DESAH|nr:hydrogenase maturation nickel metallochaperone HypA [Desulforapulum autotrophicum]ACN16220.1 HypA [Desulforapulum autotrophicum HRM2]
MHEMGVAQQMVDIALAAIPDDIENPRVAVLNLRIGKLAAVVEDSLRFCMEVITKDTPLEGVNLVIETIDVRARCKDCGHEWVVEGPAFRCPGCKQGAVELLSGRELEISSLELAD